MKGTDLILMEYLESNNLMATVGAISRIYKDKGLFTLTVEGKKLYKDEFDKIHVNITNNTVIKNMYGELLSPELLKKEDYVVATYGYMGTASELLIINEQ